MGRKTYYNKDWESLSCREEKYADQFGFWLSASKKDVHSAHCKLCSRDFDIGNMGKSALFSHAKGKNHRAKVPSGNPMTLYLESESSSPGQSTSSQAYIYNRLHTGS